MPPATVTTASGATWQEVAADRQAYRDATIAAIEPPLPDIADIPLNTIPVAKQVLTAEEIKITESTVEELVPKLADGMLSAVEVAKAFLRRAGLAQKLTNCVTELLPEKALKRAAYLDEYLKTNGKPIGPLHGIPVSLEEHIGVEGLDHNAGFVSWIVMNSISSMWWSVQKRDIYRAEYANLWNATATSAGPHGQPEGMVDVILSPVGPSAAPKLDTARWWGYTSQWNLLDYPAVVFPVDEVDTAKDAEKVKHTPRNEHDKYNWDLWEKYGAEGYKDAPLSLQLIGRRYEDEKVIQALEIIKRETELPFVDYI